MNICKVKLTELTPDPENTRIHDENNIKLIKQSLLEFGQYRPFVVQKDNMMIRVGNGMYQAMKELGWEEANCEIKDLTYEEATTLSILDNKSSDLSHFDDKKLVSVLGSFAKENLNLTGFNAVEIESSMFTTQEKKQSKFDKVGDLPVYCFLFSSKEEQKDFEKFLDYLDEYYPDNPELPAKDQPMLQGDKFITFLKEKNLVNFDEIEL